MKTKILKTMVIAGIAIFAGYNVYLANVNTTLLNVTLNDIEAMAVCESVDGYDLSRYCIPAIGRCYTWDFVANNCISNIV